MKKYFLMLFFLFSFSLVFSQLQLGIKKIKLYMVPWDIKSKFAFTVENLKDRYDYFFEAKPMEIDSSFLDYEDSNETLISQKQLPDSISINRTGVVAYAKIIFPRNKKIKIYLDRNGNYFFKNKWHYRNDELYNILFKYFSEYLVKYRNHV
jgi:hypothetical protein